MRRSDSGTLAGVVALRGIVYFALVFSVGFLLGPVRVLWLVPRVGERLAELLEAPIMLAAIVYSARFVMRRFPAATRGALLGSGALALALTLAAEIGVVLAFRGVSLGEYVGSRDPVSGAVYLALLAAFAVMPWVLGGHVDPSRSSRPSSSDRSHA